MRYNLVMLKNILTESERVVFDSMLEQKGIFHKKEAYKTYFLKVKGSVCGVLITCKKTDYLLGELSDCRDIKPFLLPDHTYIGRAKVLKPFLCEPKKFHIMKKDFCLLNKSAKISSSYKSDESTLKKGQIVTYGADSTKNMRVAFAKMKSDFILEESRKKISWKSFYLTKEEFISMRPVFIRVGDDIVGMVSSQFCSREYSMINLMYIRPEFRQYGYGRQLLKWYISFLFKKSKNIALFFSKKNTPAKKLYTSLGFKKADDWIMAVPL
jgi:GNAT superfamily N-acetyltransferase